METAEARPINDGIKLQLFGSFHADVNGSPLPRLHSRKGQWLLAVLALNLNKELSREWLAARLWPDSEPARAHFNLRQCLSNLRSAMGTQAACLLSPTSQTLSLSGQSVHVDVAEFDRAIIQSTFASWQQAVSLYAGPLLDGWNEDWVIPERITREHNYLQALENLASEALERADPATAARYLRQIITTDPFREAAHCRLMRALSDCGDHAAVTQTYQDLRSLLRDRLNASPSLETDALYKSLQETIRPSPVRDRTVPSRRLPVPLSELIGREEDVEAVTGWLRKGRIVSLIGTGGVGKTRLAIATAESIAPEFADGVWFVELAPLSDPHLVPQKAAQTLGIKEGKDRSIEEALVDGLSTSNMLLILDNCEHVLESATPLAERLLTSCPNLKILTTSRQALGLTGERIYRVPPLALPLPGSTEYEKSTSSLLEFSGIQLFIQRAGEGYSAFRLTRENSADVITVCRQLDGIPLAIEMAAARLRSLTIQELRLQLDNRFRILTTGSRTALPRHRTLRALLDWSYDLLSEPEQALLRRLSVFSGGWCLEAMAIVSGDSFDAVSLLAELTDKSLVIFEERDGIGRYRLLETVWEFACEKLEAIDEAGIYRRRHRDYFLNFAEEACPNLIGPDELLWLDKVEMELNNLRSGMQFCLNNAGEAEAGLRIGSALQIFWRVRGYWREGRDRLTALLSLPNLQTRTAVYAKALETKGITLYELGDYAGARTLYRESLAIYEELGDTWQAASARQYLAWAYAKPHEFKVALSLFEENLAVYREKNDRRGIASSLRGLAYVAHGQDNNETAAALGVEILQIFRELGDKSNIALTLVSLGDALVDQAGCTAEIRAEARTLMEEGLAIYREVGNQRRIPDALFSLGNVFYYEGDYDSAKLLYQESILLERGLDHGKGLGDSLCNLGCVHLLQNEYSQARACLEEALLICRRLGRLASVTEILLNLGIVTYAQGDFGSSRTWFEEALALTRDLRPGRLVTVSLQGIACLNAQQGDLARAARIWGAAQNFGRNASMRNNPERRFWDPNMDRTREALGEEAFAAACEEGHSMPPEHAIAYALDENEF